VALQVQVSRGQQDLVPFVEADLAPGLVRVSLLDCLSFDDLLTRGRPDMLHSLEILLKSCHVGGSHEREWGARGATVQRLVRTSPCRSRDMEKSMTGGFKLVSVGTMLDRIHCLGGFSSP
jgi:hypothetical protein